MSKKGLAIFRLLILCFGLLLIGAGYKFSPVKEGLENWRINYLWISITIAYLAIFFPILSPIPVKDSSDSFIMSGIIFTIADIILVTVSLTLGILSYKGIFSFILWPLLIQGAVFFFFLISLLICITTTSHVKSVSQTEFNKKALLSEIKQFSEQLSILSNSLGETNNELKEKMIFISNELRYISPSDNKMAKDLENKIYLNLKQISVDPVFKMPESSGQNALKISTEICLLIKQRKAVY